MGNRPAAKLLNALLYRYSIRKEHKDDAENINGVRQSRGQEPDQDTTYRIYRKQSQLVDDMCGEMTEKTLHDVAVPMLQFLGYLDIEEDLKSNCYIVNLEGVTEALSHYDSKEGLSPQLEKFLIEHMQLEKFLITSEEIKAALVNKKNFQLQLEKVLIRNRNISNCKRGRKPRSEAGSDGNPKPPKNIRDNKEKERKSTPSVPPVESSSPSTPSFSHSSSADQDETGSHIATADTRNEDLGETKNPEARAISNVPPSSFSEEEKQEVQRIAGYWKRLGFTKLGGPGHWLALSEHIHSFEDMESLFKHTQFEIRDKPNNRVYPGNLVDHLDGWKQKRMPIPFEQKREQRITVGNKHLQSFNSQARY
jgi:hypothetical protein